MMAFLADHVGRTVDVGEVDGCLEKFIDRWKSAYHVFPSGEAGWYRRLRSTERIGIVASANALSALKSAKAQFPNTQEVIKSLLGRQREDGSWPFVSTLADVSVVDSTANVLLTLHDFRDSGDRSDVRNAVDRAIKWLEESQSPDGGWGLIANGIYRTYSTALAIQALCVWEKKHTNCFQVGVQKLLATVDGATGGWKDASEHLSIPSTARTILALKYAAGEHASFIAEIGNATLWLCAIANRTEYWTKGPLAAVLEEVDVVVQGEHRRVEYGHAPRPRVIQALAFNSPPRYPEVVAGTRSMVDAISHGDWNEATGARGNEPTSWMLFDVTTAVAAFRGTYLQDFSIVWADRKRVIRHGANESALSRASRRYWIKAGVCVACILLIAGLVKTGLVNGITWAVVVTVVLAFGVNIVSNLITDLMKGSGNQEWR